jgi:hypothetical protein
LNRSRRSPRSGRSPGRSTECLWHGVNRQLTRLAPLCLALAGAACGPATEPGLSPQTSSAAARASSSGLVPSASASIAASAAEPESKIQLGRARSAITTKAQAISHFQSAWTEEVLPATAGRKRPDVKQFSASVSDAKKAGARLASCRAAHQRVDNTLGGSERTDLVFFSAIAALDRDGDCWEVEVPTGAFNEILGYLDPKTGALLCVWLVPEG